MNTETERIWGAGIASILQEFENERIFAMFPAKDYKTVFSSTTIVINENGFFIRCVKNIDNPDTGYVSVQHEGWNKPFKLHFVSNQEALLCLQSIEVSDAWTKAAKATERAFS